jgi:hypothetical protein
LLYANPPVVHGVPRRGHIGGDDDIRGLVQELIDDDAVLGGQPGISRQVATRRFADPHEQGAEISGVAVLRVVHAGRVGRVDGGGGI